MKRLLNVAFFLCLLFAVAGGGIYAGYNAINVKEDKPISNPLDGYIGKALGVEEKYIENIPLNKTVPEEDEILSERDTLLAFEYIYTDSAVPDIYEEKMPEYLINKSKEDFERAFPEWSVKEFSKDKIALERHISKKMRQKYTVSVVDGYIAVFYDEGVDGSKLKEITDTPITALPEEERQRLSDGIKVIGEDSLINILQDFGS